MTLIAAIQSGNQQYINNSVMELIVTLLHEIIHWLRSHWAFAGLDPSQTTNGINTPPQSARSTKKSTPSKYKVLGHPGAHNGVGEGGWYMEYKVLGGGGIYAMDFTRTYIEGMYISRWEKRMIKDDIQKYVRVPDEVIARVLNGDFSHLPLRFTSARKNIYYNDSNSVNIETRRNTGQNVVAMRHGSCGFGYQTSI